MRQVFAVLIALAVLASSGLPVFSQTKDAAALRRKCAHAVKVRLNIKETGNADDLKGVRGAIAEVDRCVANGGKLD